MGRNKRVTINKQNNKGVLMMKFEEAEDKAFALSQEINDDNLSVVHMRNEDGSYYIAVFDHSLPMVAEEFAGGFRNTAQRVA